MPRSTSQDCCCQSPLPWEKPLMTHACPGDHPTLAVRSGSVSCGITAPSSGSWCKQDFFVCVIQEWSLCFSQSFWIPAIKFLWPAKSDSLGIASLYTGFPSWETWRGAQNLHNKGGTYLVSVFSSFVVTHSESMGFDFIIIEPLLLSGCGFFFGYGVSVLVVLVSSCWWLFNS